MKKTTLALSALALSMGLALSPLSAVAAETASSASVAQPMPSLAPMLEKVMPSVVSINVEGTTAVNNQRLPRNFQQFFGDDSPFCQDGSPFQSSPFCQGGGAGPQGGQQQKFMALGSGVIIDAAKGYVVTNNHVVDNATSIKVQLSDGRKLDAKMVGKDPRSDIALIQIQDPKNLTAIKLADSGINTAILAPDGGNIGIGFAIPSNMVKNLTSQMVEYGQVRRGELGIMGTELSSELAKAMKVDAQRGAFVSQVMPNSSAAKAGVKAGDVIVSLNNKPINSFAALRAQVGSMPVGSKLTLGLLRDGKPTSVELELQQSSQNQVDSSSIFNGIEGAEMSNQTGNTPGVVVNSVKAGSPAARIGLKKGDIILGANQQPVKNIAELRKILDSKPSVLALNVKRGDSTLYLLMQ